MALAPSLMPRKPSKSTTTAALRQALAPALLFLEPAANSGLRLRPQYRYAFTRDGFYTQTYFRQARYEALKGKYYYKPFRSVPQNSFCHDCERDYYFIATGLADIIGLGSLFIDVLSQQLVEWESGYAPEGGAVEFFAQSFPPNVTYSPYSPAVMALDQSTAIEGDVLQADYLISMNATSNQVGGMTANQELYAASECPGST